MQRQLTCFLLLCLTCGGLCSGDVDQEQKALEEDLLSSLFTSKVKQHKQSAPYWRLSLANLCRMMSSLGRPWQEVRSPLEEEEEEVEDDDEEIRDGRSQLLEELYNLSHICQALQVRQQRVRQLLRDSLEFLDADEDSDAPLKRKSPYILKRQAALAAKSRRPYILKRSVFY